MDTYLEPLAVEQAPGWTQAVSRVIAGFPRSSVTAAWRHGWRPAELARHAERELGGVHASMAADMIADEIRGYAAATVDGRWAAQVASLDAGVWWGSDAGYLGAWQEREGATGKEAVTTAIALLHLLPVDNPHESPKASLLQAIATANRCRTVWHKQLGMSTVVGFPADLDAVELLFTSTGLGAT